MLTLDLTVGIASIIVSAALVIVVLYQVRLSKKDMDTRYRAWIGRNSKEKLDLGPDYVKLSISNYGLRPAQGITAAHYVSEGSGEKNFIESDEEPFDMSPGETIGLTIPLEASQMKKINNDTLYFGWRIEYEAGTYRGTYEIDMRYKKGGNHVISVKSR